MVCGATCTLQDPVFLPKSPDASEGAGYLIAIVNSMVTRRSEVVVLHAMALAEGPIARIRVPVFLRTGIHANWFDCARLPDGA